MALPNFRSRSATGIIVPLVSRRLLAAVTVFLVTHASVVLAQNSSSPPIQDFDWTTITPSAQLQWTNCYSSNKCARLSVPFDYSDPNGEQAAIAIIKFPSKFDQGDEGYRGPILLNPGGPGGSGVEFVLGAGQALQALIGDDFDYLGFDPRGVGSTTPQLDIFSSRQESLILQSQLLGSSANTSTASLGNVYGVAQVVGKLTLDRAEHQAEHISTPDVARDMLSIVKAHGMDRLQYWGFSYGTVLGVTFASMFPENIGRVILDGVVDAENYYAALWDNNLLDADDTLSWYYDDCVKAGPEICPIFEPTVSQIDQRISNVLERLKVAPIPFVSATDGAQAVVGYDLVKRQLFQTVYAPHETGAAFASAFAALEAGNSEEIWRLSSYATIEELLNDSCSPEADKIVVADFVALAIACGDGAPVDETLDDLKDFVVRLSEQSIFADVWTLRILCAAWKVQASDKFNGNFAGNTSNPILFIGNTADPVAPLRSAHKMAQGFPGSVVLQQNSPGHCSDSATSVCTAKAIREYFRNDTLPQPGTVCEVESSTFADPVNGANLRAREFNEYERMLLEASRDLQRIHRRVGRMF